MARIHSKRGVKENVNWLGLNKKFLNEINCLFARVTKLEEVIKICCEAGKGIWGNIQGRISDQEDLMDLFNQKADKSIILSGDGNIIGGGDLTQNRSFSLSNAVINSLNEGSTAFSWGNHANAGYLTSLPDLSVYALKTTSFTGTGEITGGGAFNTNRTFDLTSGAKTKLNNGNTAFSWGDHSLAGYLTSHQSLDSYALKATTITGTGYLTGGGSLAANRTVDMSPASKTKLDNGATAFSWGNHSTEGYLKDAPVDTKMYGRKDGAWDEVTMPTGTSIWDWDAPNGNMTVIDSSGIGNTGQALFAVGNGAGEYNAAYGTIAIGYNALQRQTKNYNIGIGTQAGESSKATQGIFIGTQAGRNADKTDIIGIGKNALLNWKGMPTDGSNTVAIGVDVGSDPATTGNSRHIGGYSVLIGYEAAKNVQSTYNDVYVGVEAGKFAGVNAVGTNNYSGNNVGIGYTALQNVVGTANVAIGGDQNSSVPQGAGRDLKGNNNVILGARSGMSTVGDNNVILGYWQVASSAGNNNTVINGGRNIVAPGSSEVTAIGTLSGSSTTLNSGDMALGKNHFLYGNGDRRLLGIGLNTTSGQPAVPRTRLDIGKDGAISGLEFRFDDPITEGIVIVRAGSISVGRTQTLQDKDGEIALKIPDGYRMIREIETPKTIAAKVSFNISLFSICPSMDFDFNDWEISWISDDKLVKLSNKDIKNLEMTTFLSPAGCTTISGTSNETSDIIIPAGAKLILRY